MDGAHGAHLPFLGVDAFAGADLVICSAHKTLPALGQSSLLFANGFEPEQVRRMTSVYGSSSPSYPMMISMDGARAWMEGEGKVLYRRDGGSEPPPCGSGFPALGGGTGSHPADIERGGRSRPGPAPGGPGPVA